MRQTLIRKLKPLLPYAALPLLLAVFFLLTVDTTSKPNREVNGENGVWDLRDFDFENYNALLVGEMVYIPNALLTPKEFAARSGEVIFGNVGNTMPESFLTSRDIILLPDGWFTFTRRSATYAQRQYVNGAWLSNAGRSVPGDTRESETPDTGRIIFTAQPQDGIVELVQQSSNFVHRQGNRHWAWQVGYSTGLVYEFRTSDTLSGIASGVFLPLFLLFLLLYFMLRRNRSALYFSLFCLMWVFRAGGGRQALALLVPWTDWAMRFRVQYFAIPVAAILTFLIINELFPKTLNKTVMRIIYIISGALIALYMFADTVIMSQIVVASYIIFGFGVVYVVAVFAAKVRSVSPEQGLFIAGLALFLFAAVSDFVFFYFYSQNFAIVPFEISGIAVLIFALCAAIAIFITTMKEVEKAKKAEQQLTAENAALDSLSRMKTEYLANIGHEIKTPLTVVSGNIQRAAIISDDLGIKDETLKRSLGKAQEEIMRMARLVESALRMATMQESREKMKPLDAAELFATSAEAYRGLIEKQGNALIVSADENLPQIYGNADQLIQVLTNLLTNANNHTENGEINVQISSQASNFVVVTVTDTGAGIPTEILPFIFERGVTGSGGTGMGLAISKGIMASHGGEIEIESKLGEGTTAFFKIPICRAQIIDNKPQTEGAENE